ncbi:MAG: hypothetical protein ABI091_14310 [Ferruginibacter sp.]
MSVANPLKKIFGNIFLLAFSLILFFTCNEPAKKDKDVPVTENDLKQQNENDSVTTLNNGVLWKADAGTNENVAAINGILKNANQVTMNDYKNTATSIQTAINKMITECKMSGKEHEVLHHWLEPLMEKNKDLSAASSVENAKEIFEEIKKQVAVYSTIFE